MFPGPESAQARGARAQVLIAAGARDEAAEVVAPLLDRGPEVMPANHQRLIGLAHAAEVTAALGIVPAAERIYLALEPFADQAVVSGVAVTFKGAVAHHLGVLAAVLGQELGEVPDLAAHLGGPFGPATVSPVQQPLVLLHGRTAARRVDHD